MELFLSYLETLIKLWESDKLGADDFVREVRQVVSEERKILERENTENATDRFFRRVEKLLKK